MSGGSRGIGREIALAAARPGASVAMPAKTAEPDLRIPGMIFSAAKLIEEAGGHAPPSTVTCGKVRILPVSSMRLSSSPVAWTST